MACQVKKGPGPSRDPRFQFCLLMPSYWNIVWYCTVLFTSKQGKKVGSLKFLPMKSALCQWGSSVKKLLFVKFQEFWPLLITHPCDHITAQCHSWEWNPASGQQCLACTALPGEQKTALGVSLQCHLVKGAAAPKFMFIVHLHIARMTDFSITGSFRATLLKIFVSPSLIYDLGIHLKK